MAAIVTYAVILAAVLAILAIAPERADARSVAVSNGGPDIDVDVLVDGLSVPWDLDFTPDETMLFTQRTGILSARLTDGTVQTVTADFSDFRASGEGGFMAILVDPNFNANRRLYTCQTHFSPERCRSSRGPSTATIPRQPASMTLSSAAYRAAAGTAAAGCDSARAATCGSRPGTALTARTPRTSLRSEARYSV